MKRGFGYVKTVLGTVPLFVENQRGDAFFCKTVKPVFRIEKVAVIAFYLDKAVQMQSAMQIGFFREGLDRGGLQTKTKTDWLIEPQTLRRIVSPCCGMGIEQMYP